MQSFPDLYTCYCDSILFLNPKGEMLKELDKIESTQHKPFYMVQKEKEEEEEETPKKKTTKKSSKKSAAKKNPVKKSPPTKKAPAKKKIVEEKEFEETLLAFSLGFRDDWSPTPLEGRNYCYLLTKGVEFIQENKNEIKRNFFVFIFLFIFF